MSSGISQINNWIGIPAGSSDTGNNKSISNTLQGGPGATFLSYDVFLGLTILGGFFALDHLYLRSPLTFLAKFIINILFFGVWWLYDASQAVFNKDVVKVFGLGIPGMGPKGVAAGVLANDVPDKKHMAFFIYALALLFGGIFGLDSFIIGDKQSGFIRLICLITGILMPVALFWWMYNLFKFFFKTKDVTSLYWDYFGAPPPAEYGMTWGEKLATKFPILQTFFGPITRIKNKVINTAIAVAEEPVLAAESIIKPAKNIIEGTIEPVIESVLQPAVNVVKPLKNTLNEGLEVAKEGLALGKEIVTASTTVAGDALKVADDTAKAATTALSLAPAAATLASGFTPIAAAQALSKIKQDGGNQESGMLSYVLVGTIILISVSGLFLSYRRYRQNGRAQNNDTPPEPRILRESDKKESS
jgi:hypothetical protein